MHPVDAQYYADGLHYKIGAHGRVYYWSGSEWMSSTRSLAEIKKAKAVLSEEDRQRVNIRNYRERMRYRNNKKKQQ